jgi:DNA-binding MarR family transcriptional regulator
MSTQESFFNDFSELTSELIRKFKLLERDEKDCFGITVSQRYTVETIYKHGNLSMKELSNEMGVAVSTMTRILDVMVRDKLVERKSSSKDRRQVFVKLTKKGKDLATKIQRNYANYLKSIFEEIPKTKKSQTIKSLHDILEALEKQPYCCLGEK